MTTHISLSGETHAALSAYCKEHDITMASLVERLSADISGGAPEPRRRARTSGTRLDRSVIDVSTRVIALVDDARAREGSREPRHDFLSRKINAWLDAQGAK